MKDFLVKLYSWDFEAAEINDSENEDKGEVEVLIEEEEDSEVIIKPKIQRKPPRIEETDDEDDAQRSDAEYLKPRIKRKSLSIDEESVVTKQKSSRVVSDEGEGNSSESFKNQKNLSIKNLMDDHIDSEIELFIEKK